MNIGEYRLGWNPADAAKENGGKPAVNRDPLPAQQGRARILVIDDEPQIRALLGATLGRRGYHVETAASGTEAFAALGMATFDLVLTDILMPDMNGMALLEKVHADYPGVPVVMVTAIHDIGVAIDAMRRGAFDYLLKPFEAGHLFKTVERAHCERLAATSRVSNRWSVHARKCSAMPSRNWSTATTSLSRPSATPST
jgi:DNA-binding NtrC family response regulator